MNIKKQINKKKIIICTVVALASIVLCILFLVYTNHSEQRRVQAFRLIEKYYGQNDYTMAELLVLDILLDNPGDEDAADWLERIREAKQKREASADNPDEERGAQDATLRSLLAEIRKIKEALTDMEKRSGDRQVVYMTQRKESVKRDKGSNEEKGLEQDITELLQSGFDAFENQDYGKAKYYFSKAVEQESAHPQANALLAASIYRENPQDQDNLKKAVTCCKTALETDKHNKLAYITLGEIYQSQGNRELAVNNYLEAISLDEYDDTLYYRVGILHYEMGEKEKAEFYFKKALELEENLPLAYLYLGRIQRKKGGLKQAVEYFNLAVSYDKNFYNAYVDMGDCYADAGDYPAALNSYETALELKQNLSVRVKKADCLLAMGMAEDAEKDYRGALEDHPPRTRREKDEAALLYHERALDAFARGDCALSRLLAETGLCAGAKQTLLYMLLGKISRGEREYVQAEAYCRKALEADGENIEAYLELALVYAEQGKKEQAVSALKLLREKVPAAADTGSFQETQRMIDAM